MHILSTSNLTLGGKEMNKNIFNTLLGLVMLIACNLAGCGSDRGTPSTAPSGVIATAGNGQVVLNWAPVAGATSYNIYYATTSGVTKTNTFNVYYNAVSPTPINGVIGLINGTTYYFVVTALNSFGESTVSAEVSATPAVGLPAPTAPTGVTAIAGNGQVTVSWNEVTGATAYNIYCSDTLGVTKATGIKIVGFASPYIVNPLVVHGLTNGSTYYFVVTALNTNGESLESSEVSATPVSQ
jgi:cellulose 1,4-beta-cellobiosidase